MSALLTETNSRAVNARIRRAARVVLSLSAKRIQTDFEHGQWWVTDLHTGAQWSVVDCQTPSGFSYVDFEQVTRGDD
jgi:predicted cupin superfamily sugar epimerase